MRRLILVMAVAMAVLSPARALAADSGSGSGSDSASVDAVTTTTINNDFLDTKRDISECLNNSIGLPDCGRAPTSAGDRGGALQYATFTVMVLGIAFIGWRVVRSIKMRDAALATGQQRSATAPNDPVKTSHDG